MDRDIWWDPDGAWVEVDGWLLGPFTTEEEVEAAAAKKEVELAGRAALMGTDENDR